MNAFTQASAGVLACLMLTGSPAQAQDDNTEAEAAKETEVKAQAQEKPATEEKKKTTQTKKTNDTFIPSEEISEDLSVSFPVDI